MFPPWLPGLVIGLLGLLASGVGWLLTDRSGKERATATAEAAAKSADSAKAEAKTTREALETFKNEMAEARGRAAAEREQTLRDIARLEERKADAATVVAIQQTLAATQQTLADLRAEIARRFEHLEARLDEMRAPPARKRSR